jgi:phospholipid/cholesterol/gamma-HCH transport system substrate-binding protein
VDELRPTARVIIPAFNALRPLLDEAAGLIADSPAQLRRIRPVVNASLPLIRRLEPTVDRFGPFVDYLRTWAPEVVNFFTLAGDSTANYDANGHMIRSTAIPIQTARHTNIIGPDDPGPGLVERPFARTPGSLEDEPWDGYEDFFIGGAE